MTKVILLADMQSFYASVEISKSPHLKGKPVVVCGDPKVRHGIALAASPEAKKWGVKTGMPAWECKAICPDTVFVRPHMQTYIDVSLHITHIFEQFTNIVVPYSIDEQFMDVTDSQRLYGNPEKIANMINRAVLSQTGVRCRIGIGENPLQAKMACDNFAKKNCQGVFRLADKNYAHHVWPLPVKKLFGVGSRIEKKLYGIGVTTVGSLAKLSRENLRHRWGVNGEILWLNANGIDYSTLNPYATEQHKSVGHSITLPRDYTDQNKLLVVLLELTEEVCRRVRKLGFLGGAIHLHCGGTDFHKPTGFSRQKKLHEPTATVTDIYPEIINLFREHWQHYPVRSLGLSLTQLRSDQEVQMSLFTDKNRAINLNSALDSVQAQFGATSLFRASSLDPDAQFFQRVKKIGGHEA